MTTTITLTVVLDEEYPMHTRIVLGAIRGIMPTLDRVALSSRLTVEPTEEEQGK
jgi:hypothetical protein